MFDAAQESPLKKALLYQRIASCLLRKVPRPSS